MTNRGNYFHSKGRYEEVFISFTFLIMEYMANGFCTEVASLVGSRTEVSLSDHELWTRIVRYGEEARRWRQKFLGLLPEVARRELWRAHGFESVFVFAFKVGGVSKEQVERVLGIEERLRDKPVLHELLVCGEVSVNKLARVVNVATIDNQEALADQVRLLSQSAVETLVRDMKYYTKLVDGEPAADQSANTSMSLSFVRAHGLARLSLGGGSFTLTPQATQKLQELHDKGIDVSEFILTAVTRREQEIQEAKEAMTTETEQKRIAKLPSRHIPIKIKKLIKQEFGTKCAITNCNKLSREIHHTARFSLAKSHDPNLLAPLCKQHHQIAHSIDVKYQECRRL